MNDDAKDRCGFWRKQRALLPLLALASGFLPASAWAVDAGTMTGSATSRSAELELNDDKPGRPTVLPRELWAPPMPRRGRGTFELFSPPEIHFDESAGVYVRADAPEAQPALTRSDFELRLSGLRVEQFPLRLIGHLGDVAEKRGVFEDRDSGEIFVAGTGRFPGREFELRDLQVSAEAGAGDGVTAIVRMLDAGQVVSLTEGRSGETGRFRAVLEFPDGVARELAAGEGVAVDGVAYRITEIDAAGLRVEVERQALGAVRPESAWITWANPDESESRETEESR